MSENNISLDFNTMLIKALRNANFSNNNHRKTPKWQNKIPIGVSGDYYTTLHCWVYGASPEYPNPTVYLGLKNGKGRAFSAISSDELQNIIVTLQQWKNEIDNVLPTLQQEATIVISQQQQLAQYQAFLQNQGKLIKDEDYSPNYDDGDF
jgi:hypothetical protein